MESDMEIEKYSLTAPLHSIEYEKEYFTKTGYEGYRDYPLNDVRAQKIIDMTHPKRVLDVGGAYGYIVKRLLAQGIHAICMEISHWCEEQAKTIIPDHFVRHDMRDTPYPFKDKEFDVVYCEGVLEHIEDKFIEAIMTEFERISHERILALTFDWHIKVAPHLSEDGLAPGHINLHSHNWWFAKMPIHSWLFYPATGIQDERIWLYKC